MTANRIPDPQPDDPPKHTRWAIAQTIARYDGAEIPGGCPHCDAHRTITPTGDNWVLRTRHHTNCPSGT